MKVINYDFKEPDFAAWEELGWKYVDHYGNAGFVFENKDSEPYDMTQLCIDFEDGVVYKERLWLENIGYGQTVSKSYEEELTPDEQDLADKELSK